MKKFKKGDKVRTHNGPGVITKEHAPGNLFSVKLENGQTGKYWAAYMKMEDHVPVKRKRKTFSLRLKGTDLWFAANNLLVEEKKNGHKFPNRKKLDEFLSFIEKGMTCFRGKARFEVFPNSFDVESILE